jgi:HlyD family secretion protein
LTRSAKIVIVASAGVVVAAGLIGFLVWKSRSKDGLPTVKVTRGAITEKAQAVGEIQPRLKFQVKSKIPGIVKSCFVEVGDTVKAGDPLFEIGPDPTPTERTEVARNLERAQASFERIQAKYDRYRELYPSGVISRQDLEDTKETFELARVALEQAKEQRELALRGKVESGGNPVESIIRAPADGTLLTRAVNPGEPIVPLTSYQPGTELASIADVRDLLFRGTVDEIDVDKLKLGLPVRIKVGALPTGTVAGELVRIAPQSRLKDGATVFDVEISLDPGQKAVLRAGYSCNASIVVREKQDVLLLPERVVTYDKDSGKASVEVPAGSSGSPAKKVPIEAGLSDGLQVEVVSGLHEGEAVIDRPPEVKKNN